MEMLELTHNPSYEIIEIVGLDPPEATLNMTKLAGVDGSVFNSSYINNRQITVTFAVNGPAERNRIDLYRWFRPKYKLRVYYVNGERNVYIDGYIQNVDIQYFEMKQNVQVVLDCPQPYFKSYYNDSQEFSNTIGMFEFEMDIPPAGTEFGIIALGAERAIRNFGDVDTGAVFKMYFYGAVDTPRIYNVDTREYFVLDRSFEEGDLVTINTRIGEKEVTLRRDGVDHAIIGYLREGSTWFQLAPGDNIFTIVADDGEQNMRSFIEVIDQFEGV